MLRYNNIDFIVIVILDAENMLKAEGSQEPEVLQSIALTCGVMSKVFQAYLSSVKLIREKYLLYYIKWMSDCCSYFNETVEGSLTIDKRYVFLTPLEESRGSAGELG
jgi:hypothetical protein